MEALLRRPVYGLAQRGLSGSGLNGRSNWALIRVPRYRFNVRNTDRFDDEDSVILPDDGTAREYAIQIMDELPAAVDGNRDAEG
jgi:Domain of unknown function (DUF6894)